MHPCKLRYFIWIPSNISPNISATQDKGNTFNLLTKLKWQTCRKEVSVAVNEWLFSVEHFRGHRQTWPLFLDCPFLFSPLVFSNTDTAKTQVHIFSNYIFIIIYYIDMRSTMVIKGGEMYIIKEEDSFSKIIDIVCKVIPRIWRLQPGGSSPLGIHNIVDIEYPSSIYGFWLPLWYLQTF